MAAKITYYAIVDSHTSRAEPSGVLRRVEDDSGEYDEEFGHDLAWTRSWVLYSYEQGNGDNQLYEISADEAERIVESIRGSATGQP
jgi:hypothetical protein